MAKKKTQRKEQVRKSYAYREGLIRSKMVHVASELGLLIDPEVPDFLINRRLSVSYQTSGIVFKLPIIVERNSRKVIYREEDNDIKINIEDVNGNMLEETLLEAYEKINTFSKVMREYALSNDEIWLFSYEALTEAEQSKYRFAFGI